MTERAKLAITCHYTVTSILDRHAALFLPVLISVTCYIIKLCGMSFRGLSKHIRGRVVLLLMQVETSCTTQQAQPADCCEAAGQLSIRQESFFWIKSYINKHFEHWQEVAWRNQRVKIPCAPFVCDEGSHWVFFNCFRAVFIFLWVSVVS